MVKVERKSGAFEIKVEGFSGSDNTLFYKGGKIFRIRGGRKLEIGKSVCQEGKTKRWKDFQGERGNIFV